ncbi:uncharacterized protein LOC117590492 [Drosophila guanche]|uniref:DUF4777 domain-containing protein n=1 Tax=Drosophila guanche TaxID=7266 RepID=A0A3B0KU91_DROGU|nr:uncharacterized protein LOC117590492 [Drosophila guanche]SPP88861.1 Hypothetical predicted protein [Drosophila guanche]
MARYLYADRILEAFNAFHRPMEFEEVVAYVAELEIKSAEEVRLNVDKTLTAAWMHGFVKKTENWYTLNCGYWNEDSTQGRAAAARHADDVLCLRIQDDMTPDE